MLTTSFHCRRGLLLRLYTAPTPSAPVSSSLPSLSSSPSSYPSPSRLRHKCTQAQSQLQFAQAGARTRAGGVAAVANAIKASSTTASWHGMAQRRQLHLTPACHTFRPVWTERRVKMPWVEALELEKEKEREREREREKAETEAGVDAGVERRGGASLPKVDLQPRKMGDSYYRGVSILFWFGLFCAPSLFTYFDDVFDRRV